MEATESHSPTQQNKRRNARFEDLAWGLEESIWELATHSFIIYDCIPHETFIYIYSFPFIFEGSKYVVERIGSDAEEEERKCTVHAAIIMRMNVRVNVREREREI